MRFIVAGLLLCASLAHAGVPVTSEHMNTSFDGKIYSEYPNGDKPQDSCTEPDGTDGTDGWTTLAKGTADGLICVDSSTQFTITALGIDDEGDILLAYQTCGTGDCEVIAAVPGSADWIGHLETFTTFGVGISEGTGDSDWYMQAWVTPDGRARCKAGTPGPDDFNSIASAGITAPLQVAIAHDDDGDELRCLLSTDGGSSWSTYGTFSRDLAEPAIGYVFGTSHDDDETTTATLTSIALATTISTYTPEDPDPPDPGNPAPVCGTIENQSFVQDITITPIDVADICTDEDPEGVLTYTASGLSGHGLGIGSSTGLITGVPNSTAVSDSPFDVTVTVTDIGLESTVVTFQVTVSGPVGSGSVFTIPDVGDSTDSTFNCATTGGANGSSWASIRTSGSGTRPQAGDTILITSGTRGDTTFQNCEGSPSSPITVNKTASSTRLTFSGNNTSAGAGILMCNNCVGMDWFPSNNWTGHTGGCGANRVATGISATPLSDCGVLITATQAYNGFRLKGERRYHTIQNIEVDGNWNGNPSSTTAIRQGIFTNDQAYCPGAPAAAPIDIDDTSTNWVEHITIRNVYVHDTRGPSTYLGLNVSIQCGGEYLTLPNQRHLLVENSYFADSGSNGIHVKRCSDSDPTSCVIRYNYITRIGGSDSTSEGGANNKPIACYEASCTAYGNVVDTTIADDPEGPGISCAILHRPLSFRTQVCRFYNNLVFDTRGHGLQASRDNNSPRTGDTAAMQIIWEYNTLADVALASGNCINAAGTVTGSGSVVRNNICAGADTSIATSVTESNNRTGTVASQNFSDQAGEDYRLTTSSPARDAGTSTGCPSDDIVGTSRPKGTGCDQGAFEYAP